MRRIFAMLLALTMVLAMTACGAKEEAAPAQTTAAAASEVITGVEDGVLTVGMECAYAPYNWTQMDDSNGAVPIANNPGDLRSQRLGTGSDGNWLGWSCPRSERRSAGCCHRRSVHDRDPDAGS